MTHITELAQLRAELSNPAVGSKDHLRKLALSLVEALELKEEQRANWFQMAQKLGEDLDAAEKRIAELESRTVKLPDSLDFDCEMENGDYDIDEEPYLRGKVDGFNYALTKVRRLNGDAGIKWEAE